MPISRRTPRTTQRGRKTNKVSTSKKVTRSTKKLTVKQVKPGTKKVTNVKELYANSEVKFYSGEDILKMEFNTVKLPPGAWHDTIGKEIGFPTHFLIEGKAGGGKSRYCVRFATVIARQLDKAVLYVTVEEDPERNATVQRKVQESRAIHPNITYVAGRFEKVQTYFNMYDVVIIDSITSLQSFKVKDFKTLIEKYPKTSFIMISQQNKQGRHRGEAGWGYEVDVHLKFEDGYIHVLKSRWLDKPSGFKVKIT